MTFQPKTFDETLFEVGTPVKAEGEHDYCTFTTKYKGNKTARFFTTTPMKFTALKPNPKRPGRLGTGGTVEDPVLLEMFKKIDAKTFAKVFAERNHKDMSKTFKSKLITSAEVMPDAIPRCKGCLYYPKEKDAKGEVVAGKLAEGVAPRIYLDLIQRSDGTEIFTKFKSAQVLNSDVAAKLKSGQAKIADYTFAPEVLKGTAFEALVVIEIQDVYASDSDLKIRMCLQEVYITKFIARESEGEKNIREEMTIAGVTFDGPGVVPEAPVESEKKPRKGKATDDSGTDDGEDDDREFVVHTN
ncbi:MAG: hypothetical protein ACMG6E_00505 [Candidatus Roizmanbacteria bacterium]